jgi:transposase
MTGKRTRYAAEFKAKVALEALRGDLTTAQLAAKHGIHQTIVSEWKRQAGEGLASVFAGRSAAQGTAKATKAEVEKLHAKIGQLLVERNCWRKRPVDEPGAATAGDRAQASAAVDRAPVRVDVDQPIRLLPPSGWGEPAEPGTDAPDRWAVPKRRPSCASWRRLRWRWSRWPDGPAGMAPGKWRAISGAKPTRSAVSVPGG